MTRSSNPFLKSLDMDRSTFYKIKSGKRKSTKAQFCEIMRHLKPKGAIRRQLIEEFEMERLWNSEHSNLLLIVREFLSYLNCKENFEGKELNTPECSDERLPVPKYITDVLRGELQREMPGKIRLRICPAVFDRYNWDALWSILDTADSVLEFDFLLNNSVEENYDVIRKLHHTEIYFSFMKSGKVRASVYRENFCDKDAVWLEDPYPFYLIASDEMVLIREDLEEYLILRKESVIRNYQKSFEKRLLHSYAVMEPYDDQEMMQNMLLQQFCRCAGNEMDIFTLSGQVSLLPAIPEQVIRRVFPEDLAGWLCEIRQFYIESDAYAFVSEHQYYESLKLMEMVEWGESAEFTEAERQVIADGMEQRRKDGKLILIPDYYNYIPDQATIHLFGGEEMFLMLWEHDNVLVRIRERELIDGMYQWFQNRSEIGDIEKQIGIEENRD